MNEHRGGCVQCPAQGNDAIPDPVQLDTLQNQHPMPLWAVFVQWSHTAAQRCRHTNQPAACQGVTALPSLQGDSVLSKEGSKSQGLLLEQMSPRVF